MKSYQFEKNDILRGGDAITEFLNELIDGKRKVTRSQTYHWIEAGHIPAGRVGNMVFASKIALRERFTQAAGRAT